MHRLMTIRVRVHSLSASVFCHSCSPAVLQSCGPALALCSSVFGGQDAERSQKLVRRKEPPKKPLNTESDKQPSVWRAITTKGNKINYTKQTTWTVSICKRLNKLGRDTFNYQERCGTKERPNGLIKRGRCETDQLMVF